MISPIGFNFPFTAKYVLLSEVNSDEGVSEETGAGVCPPPPSSTAVIIGSDDSGCSIYEEKGTISTEPSISIESTQELEYYIISPGGLYQEINDSMDITLNLDPGTAENIFEEQEAKKGAHEVVAEDIGTFLTTTIGGIIDAAGKIFEGKGGEVVEGAAGCIQEVLEGIQKAADEKIEEEKQKSDEEKLIESAFPVITATEIASEILNNLGKSIGDIRDEGDPDKMLNAIAIVIWKLFIGDSLHEISQQDASCFQKVLPAIDIALTLIVVGKAAKTLKGTSVVAKGKKVEAVLKASKAKMTLTISAG